MTEINEFFSKEYENLDDEPDSGYEVSDGDSEPDFPGIEIESPDPEEDEDDE